MSESALIKADAAQRYMGYVSGLPARIRTARDLEEQTRIDMRYVSDLMIVGSDDLISRMKKAADGYAAEADGCENERRLARECLRSIANADHARMLELHYVDGLEWSDVCERCHYSYSGAMSARKRALAALHDVMPQRWRVDGNRDI